MTLFLFLDIETDIAVTAETEYQKYAYNKPDDIWALVTLKAPCHELETQRAPIDVVAVIDKSGSMSGAKLNLVKQTLEFFITQCELFSFLQCQCPGMKIWGQPFSTTIE